MGLINTSIYRYKEENHFERSEKCLLSRTIFFFLRDDRFIEMENSSLNTKMHLKADVVYLHGFASSPSSAKAQQFEKSFATCGARVKTPDLNVPSFRELTIAAQIDVAELKVREFAGKNPVVLVGSSMGGLIACLLSQRLKNIAAMILMAPGFGIARRWKEFVSEDEYAKWKETGAHLFFHHAENRQMPLGYQFAVDLESRSTDDLVIDVPCLVFHGKNDTTVPVKESENFRANNPDLVELKILDDDHQLLSSLDYIIEESFNFLSRAQILSADHN